MPTLLVKNVDVRVTMDTQCRELKGAELYAENGIIKEIGQAGELPATADAVLDLSGQIESFNWPALVTTAEGLEAKSQGECAINPIVPAIANAIKNATGVRFSHPPFTAAHIYSQLNKRK